MLMAGAPVPDRPNIHSNASPWLKVPVHADVLIRTRRGEALADYTEKQGAGFYMDGDMFAAFLETVQESVAA
jgi:hypothetical protein